MLSGAGVAMKNPGMGMVWVFVLAAGWPGLVGAQQSEPLPQRAWQRVVTTTRLVTLFSELETEWLQRVQQKDSPALERLLGEDFLELSPNAAGPVPREDWQQRALAQDLQSFRLRQMAVRSLNEETAVASFVLSESVQSGGALQERSSFVVDVWTRTSGRWVCTGRYVSPVSGAGSSAVQDAKPSGKH
jgi:hypothetical protein